MPSVIERFLQSEGGKIEKELEAVIPRKGVPNLNDAVWYHLDSGGKRLRPVLAIATCRAFHGNERQVLPFAAACELFHNWLLVHDDIEDGDTIRRSQPALWQRFGVGHGINVGDYMSEKVYELVLRCGTYGLEPTRLLMLLQKVAETGVMTAIGQAHDLNTKGRQDVSEQEYMETVTLKTALYLMLPILGAATIAGAKEDELKRLERFGMLAGPAFQIADDILDLTAGKGRDEIGCDIKEGKRSLMVIHCSGKCTKEERAKLYAILDKERSQTTNQDIEWVQGLFARHGSVAYAEAVAKKLIAEAKLVSAAFRPEVREVLDGFADYMIERKS
ncbi:MAG: polyprenyl synthetase family protein [Candidatus Aenigmarchaeota archaeon]|nr:polyprenyl synthetase family protein [Candidatus Aenigmarchaeota archaeon]